jgi:hypothetical protein
MDARDRRPDANIVCNLPRRCPRVDLREFIRRSTPARGPQGRVGRTGGRAPGGDGDLVPAAGPHRLTVCKSDWQISGKRQLSALKPSNRPGTYPASTAGLGWSPPPESNRRPPPYHGSAAKCRANRRLRSSRNTVNAAGMCLVAGLGSARGQVLTLPITSRSEPSSQFYRDASPLLTSDASSNRC